MSNATTFGNCAALAPHALTGCAKSATTAQDPRSAPARPFSMPAPTRRAALLLLALLALALLPGLG
ncbi:MAG TPA: hypothetical protein VF678_13800, partial [bacterium]